jgi:hypothetical protein
MDCHQLLTIRISVIFFALPFSPPPASPEEYPDLSVTPDTDLPYPEVAWSEVRQAIFTPRQNTAPGPCGTPFRAVRWCWKAQNQLIHQLFSGCCKVGHHPLIWKDSLSVALAKPNKPDYSQPHAYRLIALLSCWSKVLEKIQATRLGWLAAHFRLLPINQYGGAPSCPLPPSLGSSREKSMAKTTASL